MTSTAAARRGRRRRSCHVSKIFFYPSIYFTEALATLFSQHNSSGVSQTDGRPASVNSQWWTKHNLAPCWQHRQCTEDVEVQFISTPLLLLHHTGWGRKHNYNNIGFDGTFGGAHCTFQILHNLGDASGFPSSHFVSVCKVQNPRPDHTLHATKQPFVYKLKTCQSR